MKNKICLTIKTSRPSEGQCYPIQQPSIQTADNRTKLPNCRQQSQAQQQITEPADTEQVDTTRATAELQHYKSSRQQNQTTKPSSTKQNYSTTNQQTKQKTTEPAYIEQADRIISEQKLTKQNNRTISTHLTTE